MTWIKRLSILLVSCSSILLIIETILRYTYVKKYQEPPWQTANKFKIDNQLIYKLNNNTVTEWKTSEFYEKVFTNNMGFRHNQEITPKKQSNTIRIFAVGDSWTFGHGLFNEETYPYYLEKELNQNKQSDRIYEVINAGVPGYTPDQEFKLMSERLIKLDPDVIIWNLTNGDIAELTESFPSLYSINNVNNLIPLDARFNWMYVQNFLFLNTPSTIKQTYTFDYLISQLPNIYYASRKPNLPFNERLKWSYNKLILFIQKMNTLGRSKNFLLLIVRLPTLQDFSSGDSKTYQASFFSILQQKLKSKEVHFLDLRYDISQTVDLGINSLDDLFFQQDTHPTKISTKLFANLVSKYILKNLSL